MPASNYFIFWNTPILKNASYPASNKPYLIAELQSRIQTQNCKAEFKSRIAKQNPNAELQSRIQKQNPKAEFASKMEKHNWIAEFHNRIWRILYCLDSEHFQSRVEKHKSEAEFENACPQQSFESRFHKQNRHQKCVKSSLKTLEVLKKVVLV